MNLLDTLKSLPEEQRFSFWKEHFKGCNNENERQEAIGEYENTSDQAPVSGDFYFYIGKYYLALNSDLGEKYLLKGAELLNAKACKELAEYYLRKNNREKSREYLEKAAELKVVECQFLLAKDLFHENRNREGFYWMKNAAKAGHLEAQYRTGYLYRQAIGVQKDLTASLYWLTKAAMVAYGPAAYLLGKMYEKGEGIEPNRKAAEKWYRLAVSSYERESSMKAYFALAMMYEKSSKDIAKAFSCWENLSILGDRDAQYKLGLCYYNGTGVERDKHQAFWWLNKSSKGGNAKALGMLRKM